MFNVMQEVNKDNHMNHMNKRELIKTYSESALLEAQAQRQGCADPQDDTAEVVLLRFSIYIDPGFAIECTHKYSMHCRLP